MTPWVEAAIAKYGWIAAGIMFGFAAKYGLLMKRGKPITFRMVAADMLLVGMVSLIAFNLVARMGVEGEIAALIASLVAVGADRAVRIMTDRFWAQVDAALERDVAERKALLREEAQIELSTERTIKDIAEGKRPLGGE
ncbi:MAG: hypothetical protein WBL20_20150 [Sphingobium sp.]